MEWQRVRNAKSLSQVSLSDFFHSHSSVFLNYSESPEILRVPQDLIIPEKSEALFECEVDAFPSAKITWLKDGKPLTVKEGVEIQAQTDKGLYTLRIPQADTSRHMGTIICRAENAIGTAEHPVQLNITTAPTLKSPLKDLEVLRGQDAVFSIDIQGYPIPEITWSCGEKVLEGENQTISLSEDRKQLTVRNVQIENENEYHVRIVNEFGETTNKAKLSVLGTFNIHSNLLLIEYLFFI